MDRRPDRTAGLEHARAFVEPDAVVDGRVYLAGQEYAHLVRVLRKRAGDPIELVDGRGRLFRGRLESLADQSAWAAVEEVSAPTGQPAVRIGLAVPRLRGDLTEQVIRQATELGATDIWIYGAERAAARLRPAVFERWQRVARGALVQSRRLILPDLRYLADAAAVALAAGPFERRWLAEPAGCPAGQAAGAGPAASRLALVGPAGGIAPSERRTLLAAAFEEVSLGPRRLRSETAAVTLLALALLASGELRPAGPAFHDPRDPISY